MCTMCVGFGMVCSKTISEVMLVDNLLCLVSRPGAPECTWI
jgi:hypothetical protein